jgi:hypothetical protein
MDVVMESGLQQVAGRYGFRRIAQVRIVYTADGVVAYATGVAHRYPHSVRVPMGVAAELVTAGIPLAVERDEVRA